MWQTLGAAALWFLVLLQYMSPSGTFPLRPHWLPVCSPKKDSQGFHHASRAQCAVHPTGGETDTIARCLVREIWSLTNCPLAEKGILPALHPAQKSFVRSCGRGEHWGKVAKDGAICVAPEGSGSRAGGGLLLVGLKPSL